MKSWPCSQGHIQSSSWLWCDGGLYAAITPTTHYCIECVVGSLAVVPTIVHDFACVMWASTSLKALESGTMESRSSLGQQFTSACKLDNRLLAQYQACGRSYALQREFKLKWCKLEYDKEVEKQTTETSTDKEGMEYHHYQLSQLVWHFKSREAGLNYMQSALRKGNAGELWRGKPWARLNIMTKFWEFLLVEQYGSTEATTSWRMTSKKRPAEIADGGSTSPAKSPKIASPGARSNALADEAAEEPEEDTKQQKAKAKSKAKGKGGAKAKAKAASKTPPEVDDATKETKKIIEKEISKCKALKLRCDTAQTQAQEILSAISENLAWKKWAGEKQINMLNEPLAALTDVKKSSEFWITWTTSSSVTFGQWAKKTYKCDELLKHTRSSANVEAAAEAVEMAVKVIRGMRKVNGGS